MSDLREALRSLHGVVDARVELGNAGPVGVRVRIAPDADSRLVAEAIQQVLSEFGLRSRVAPPRRRLQPAAPPPPPDGQSESPRPVPGGIATPMAAAAPAPSLGQALGPPPGEPPAPQPAPERRATGKAPRDRPPALASLSVEEGRGEVKVTVRRADGAQAEQRARPNPQGLREAIVAAVGTLATPGAPLPRLAAVTEEEVSDRRLVTVVVEAGAGALRAGSALVEASWEFAFARAVWSALAD